MGNKFSELPFRMSAEANPGLVVIDIQEKFKPAVPVFDAVAARAVVLIRGFKALQLPVFATEQYPKGLGPTIDQVAAALSVEPPVMPVAKKHFSCCGAEGFQQQIEKTRVKTACVCGIETHVCVYQTVLDLLERGVKTVVVVDACGSRKESDHTAALRRMEHCGAVLLTVEMILFDLLKTAEAEKFREIQNLLK
jgi:nicotinamidase-related amidase